MEPNLRICTSEEETYEMGVEFAARLRAGDVVAFYGDLGAGKTEFIKGICEGLKVSDLVSSPTFTIVNEYAGEDAKGREIIVQHIDLYRIESPKELDEIGFDEIVRDEESIKLIEWAEIGEDRLPPDHYEIRIGMEKEEECRCVRLSGHGVAEQINGYANGGNGVNGGTNGKGANGSVATSDVRGRFTRV